MWSGSRIALAGLAGAVAGCMATPPPPPEPPHPPIGTVGRYRGFARLVRASGGGCPRSGARVLEVDGDSISLSYRLSARQLVRLTAPIAPDGSIHADDGTGSIDGHVGDGRLELTVASPACENRWVMNKVDP